jgi:hypothetical protein
MDKKISADVMTPLQMYAYQANELYLSFQDAGFSQDEAWALLLNHLPDFEIPVYMESIDINLEGEDNGSEETSEEDDC